MSVVVVPAGLSLYSFYCLAILYTVGYSFCMSDTAFSLEYFQKENGAVPFRDWLHGLRDRHGVERIRARLARVRAGNFGKVRGLGDGVSELKVDHGPGYRLYYAMSGTTVVLLLVGGDKSTQQQDIQSAKQFWREYQGG